MSLSAAYASHGWLGYGAEGGGLFAMTGPL
jgi:hypothetical protein